MLGLCRLVQPARQEGLVPRRLLRVPHLQRLLRLQVQRDGDGREDADVPGGDRDNGEGSLGRSQRDFSA